MSHWIVGLLCAFGLSSISPAYCADARREALSNQLVQVNAPMAALKDRYPDFYSEVLDIYVDAVKEGGGDVCNRQNLEGKNHLLHEIRVAGDQGRTAREDGRKAVENHMDERLHGMLISIHG